MQAYLGDSGLWWEESESGMRERNFWLCNQYKTFNFIFQKPRDVLAHVLDKRERKVGKQSVALSWRWWNSAVVNDLPYGENASALLWNSYGKSSVICESLFLKLSAQLVYLQRMISMIAISVQKHTFSRWKNPLQKCLFCFLLFYFWQIFMW